MLEAAVYSGLTILPTFATADPEQELGRRMVEVVRGATGRVVVCCRDTTTAHLLATRLGDQEVRVVEGEEQWEVSARVLVVPDPHLPPAPPPLPPPPHRPSHRGPLGPAGRQSCLRPPLPA